MKIIIFYFFYNIFYICYINGKPTNDFNITETCINKFCPQGTYCEVKNNLRCNKPPCRPLLICLPESVNGCATKTCLKNQQCIEKNIPCINKICKKVARCVKPGTCESLVCPPSHRCKTNPQPHCVRGIFTLSEVAQLSQVPNE